MKAPWRPRRSAPPSTAGPTRRVHAAERLIDILIDTARDDGVADGLDVRMFKKRAFLAVLESEAESLSNSSDLIAALTTEVRNL